MKWGASTLKVADSVLSTELWDQTMAVFPFPFPRINILGLFAGMLTFSLHSYSINIAIREIYTPLICPEKRVKFLFYTEKMVPFIIRKDTV